MLDMVVKPEGQHKLDTTTKLKEERWRELNTTRKSKEG